MEAESGGDRMDQGESKIDPIIYTDICGEAAIEGVTFEDKTHWRDIGQPFTYCGRPAREYD